MAGEVREEAGLEVSVGLLLYDVPAGPPDGTYIRWRTYLCRVTSGEAAPGTGEGWAELTAVRWLPLDRLPEWEPALCTDPYLYPQLLRIRTALGESDASSEASKG